jgi:hypothetical protein
MPTLDQEPPIRRDELPVCKMCRAGIHRLCARTQLDWEPCVCDCKRGY